MLLLGTITKRKAAWIASCEAIGAITQAGTLETAIASLADAVEVLVDKKGFRAKVSDVGGDRGERTVLIDATEPAVLCAAVLRYQRGRSKLSLADVAERLGKSRNTYATYERGEREPSLSQFRELLAAVAPDMALMVGPRKGRAA
jgi:DNA-binding XRE family transcriptional regulator